MIQIRHVPEEIHRRLKARASLEGLSLSEFLLREVAKLSAQPTLEDMRARLSPVKTRASAAAMLRQERERR